MLLDAAASTIVFDGVTERPVLSINRGFSAPVIVESDRSAADLAFLSGMTTIRSPATRRCSS